MHRRVDKGDIQISGWHVSTLDNGRVVGLLDAVKDMFDEGMSMIGDSLVPRQGRRIGEDGGGDGGVFRRNDLAAVGSVTERWD